MQHNQPTVTTDPRVSETARADDSLQPDTRNDDLRARPPHAERQVRGGALASAARIFRTPQGQVRSSDAVKVGAATAAIVAAAGAAISGGAIARRRARRRRRPTERLMSLLRPLMGGAATVVTAIAVTRGVRGLRAGRAAEVSGLHTVA